MQSKKTSNTIIQQYYLMHRHQAQIQAILQVISCYVALLENPQLFLPHAGHISISFRSHSTDMLPVSLMAAANVDFYDMMHSSLSQQAKAALLLEKGFPMQLFSENMRIYPAHGYAVCVSADMPLPLAEMDVPIFLQLMYYLLGEKFPQYDVSYSTKRLLLSAKKIA